MSEQICSHLDTIEHLEGREGVEGCPECLAMGSRWVHLRRCTECGAVGCCDDSPNRHATAHHHRTSHPVIRSARAFCCWCRPVSRRRLVGPARYSAN